MQPLPHHLYLHCLKTAVTTSLIKDRMTPDLGETNHDSVIPSVIRVVRSYAKSMFRSTDWAWGLDPRNGLGLSSAESTSGAQTVYHGFADASSRSVPSGMGFLAVLRNLILRNDKGMFLPQYPPVN